MAYLKCAILQAADEPDTGNLNKGWAHDHLTQSQIPDVLMPVYGGGPAGQNLDGLDQDLGNAWPQIETFIQQEQQKAGWTKVNIIGHSMGGVVARAVAAKHSDSVKTVVTIGSPDAGVSAADAYCWVPLTNPIGWLGQVLGLCVPGAIRDIQTGVMKGTIDKQYPDVPYVTYYALAGTNGTSTCVALASYLSPAGSDSDSCVTVGSQEYLLKDNPDNQGIGTEIGGPAYEFYATHPQETNTWGNWQQEMICLVMGPPAPCPPGRPAPASSRNTQSAASSSADPQISSIVDGSIVPYSTAQLPLSFEGAQSASLSVYSSAAGLTASFGSTELTTSPADSIWLSYAALTGPNDGPLAIGNPTSSTIYYRVVVAIPTTRELSP
jgi:hypothetical protein